MLIYAVISHIVTAPVLVLGSISHTLGWIHIYLVRVLPTPAWLMLLLLLVIWPILLEKLELILIHPAKFALTWDTVIDATTLTITSHARSWGVLGL